MSNNNGSTDLPDARSPLNQLDTVADPKTVEVYNTPTSTLLHVDIEMDLDYQWSSAGDQHNQTNSKIFNDAEKPASDDRLDVVMRECEGDLGQTDVEMGDCDADAGTETQGDVEMGDDDLERGY